MLKVQHIKIKDISGYLKKLDVEVMHVAIFSEILILALEDDIDVLLLTEEEYEILRRGLIYSGIASWDWDRETVYGIELKIKPKDTK